MVEDYKTVLMTDNKGRVTIPLEVRKQLNIEDKIIFRLIYKFAENEILLLPIGESDTK